MRTILASTALFLVLLVPSTPADTIGVRAGDLGIYAGGGLSIGRNSSISGSMGGMDSIWIDRDSHVSGSVYAYKDFSSGRNLSIGGDLISLRNAWLDKDSIVSGDIHTQNGFGAGQNAQLGNVFSGGDISLDRQAGTGTLNSGGSIWVDRDSVTGRLLGNTNVDLGRNIFVDGSIDAGRDIGIDRDSHITGNATYGRNGWANNQATIDGTFEQGTPASPATPDSWEVTDPTPRWSPASTAYGSENQNISSGQTTALQAGQYRDLWAGRNATLELGAGEYNFRNVSLDSGVSILADTTAGDIFLIADRDFSLASDGLIDVTGPGNVWVFSGKDIWLGSGAHANATLIADRNMWIDGDSMIQGQLYAGDSLGLGNGVVVDATGVPEPGLTVLLGAGMLWLSRRHRG